MANNNSQKDNIKSEAKKVLLLLWAIYFVFSVFTGLVSPGNKKDSFFSLTKHHTGGFSAYSVEDADKKIEEEKKIFDNVAVDNMREKRSGVYFVEYSYTIEKLSIDQYHCIVWFFAVLLYTILFFFAKPRPNGGQVFATFLAYGFVVFVVSEFLAIIWDITSLAPNFIL